MDPKINDNQVWSAASLPDVHELTLAEFRYEELAVGQKAGFTAEITRAMEDSFRQITGDVNPLHSDDDFARAVGGGRFPGHVSFGFMTASLYSTLAGVCLPGRYSLVHSVDDLKFLRPVRTGMRLTVEGEIAEKEDALRLIVVKGTIRDERGKAVSTAKIKVLVLE